ncbi:MAG: hypothetical protein ACTJFR_03305 [Canibacter sp.]
MARKHSPSTEVALYSAPKKKTSAVGGFVRAGLAGVFTVALVGVGTMPAYAHDAMEDPLTFALRTQPQTLSTGESQEVAAPEVSIESVLEALPEPEPEVVEETDTEAADGETGEDGQAADVPVGANSAALVRAMFDQLGVGQDCTDAVQNGLAAIGLVERRDAGGPDLGPMSFGEFGTPIDPSQAKPGDIMMSGGHVAVYTGDGSTHSAVHGGWTDGGSHPESTVFRTGDWSSPYSFDVVIRLS